jgi:hypothetical protein
MKDVTASSYQTPEETSEYAAKTLATCVSEIATAETPARTFFIRERSIYKREKVEGK